MSVDYTRPIVLAYDPLDHCVIVDNGDHSVYDVWRLSDIDDALTEIKWQQTDRVRMASNGSPVIGESKLRMMRRVANR